MTRQRIAPMNPPYSDPVQQAFQAVMPAGMPPLNLFRTLAHNERVLSRLVSGSLLDRGSISLANRELVILRTCARCGAEYEWGVHVAGFATQAGLSTSQIAATCSPDIQPGLWSEQQILLLRLVDELHESATLSEALWKDLSLVYNPEQQIELIMLAGLYHAVSFVANALGVQNESFAPPFPETTALTGSYI